MTTVGAACAVLATIAFVVAIALAASSGVDVFIPPTDDEGVKWLVDVEEAGGAAFAGFWIGVLGGLLVIVAYVGFYDALRAAGPVFVLAPIFGVVGMTFVTFSHLIPIAIAYELAPAYVDADATTQATLATTSDTLATVAQVTDYTGNALGWGVAVPLFAVAVLRTSVVRRWIGWLGLVVAVLAGWLGLLAPASGIAEGLGAIGFVGFFVFLAAMGVALLRRPKAIAAG